MKELESIFKGVASQRRIRIIKALLPDKQLTVGEIASKIELSFRSTSKHLIKLEKEGYLKNRPEGIWRVYYLNPAPPKTVKKVIAIVRSYKEECG